MKNTDAPSISTRRGFLTIGAASAAAILAGETLMPAQPAEAATTVASVNGKTGVVTLSAGDVSAAPASQADGTAVVALPSRFSGIDPTGAADSTEGLQRAISATPDGGTLVVPPGRYKINGTLNVTGEKSITVSAFSAHFIQNAAGSVFSVGGSYSDPITVSSISTSNLTLPGGSVLPATVLKLASSPSWVTGDVLKLVSDDLIVGARPGSSGSESRIGEFVVVRSVSGSTVTLAGLVREPYKTNIRVARISTKTFALEGAEFETTATGLTQNYGSVVYLYRLMNPTISRVKVKNSSSAVLHFASCFGYSVYDADVSYAVDNPDNDQVGYGVFDNGSSHGRVIGGVFRHVRHAYTDDSARISANSDVQGYGRTYGTHIVGASALMTTSNSFDTHHSSEGVEFTSCTATGALAQSTVGVAGFGLRGKNHRVSSCTVKNIEVGVNVFTESVGGESRGHVITNLVVRDASNAAVQVQVRTGSHPNSNIRDTEENASIDGLLARGTRRLLSTVNAVVTMRNSEYLVSSGTAGVAYDGITQKNSRLRIYNTVLDYSANTQGNPRPVVGIISTGSNPGAQETTIDTLKIRASASVASRITKPFSGISHKITGRNIVMNYPFSVMPGDATDDSVLGWACSAGTTATNGDLNSSYVYVSLADCTKPFAKVVQSQDSQVYVRAVPGANAYTAGALPAGRIRGQRVTVWINDTSGGSVTFRNGADYRSLFVSGASKVLKKGMQLTVFWDGTIWREVA